MKRDFFLNIFAFLLLCDNATYIKKGHGGYDPRKKLFFSINLLLKDYVSYGDLDQIYRLVKVMYHSKEEPILNFITRARLINVV